MVPAQDESSIYFEGQTLSLGMTREQVLKLFDDEKISCDGDLCHVFELISGYKNSIGGLFFTNDSLSRVEKDWIHNTDSNSIKVIRALSNLLDYTMVDDFEIALVTQNRSISPGLESNTITMHLRNAKIQINLIEMDSPQVYSFVQIKEIISKD